MADRALAIVIVVWVGFVPAALADDDAGPDWPMLQRDVRRTGRIDAPGIAEPALAWRLYVGACDQRNAPIVIGDDVFIAGSGRAVGFRRLPGDGAITCVDRWSGLPRWSRFVDGDCGGIVFDEGQLFAVHASGVVRAMDPRYGGEVWRRRITDFHTGAHPLPMRGRLAVSTQMDLHWLRQATGRREFTAQTIRSSRPPDLASDGVDLFVANSRHTPLRVTFDDADLIPLRGGEDYLELGQPIVVGDGLVVFGIEKDWPGMASALIGVEAERGLRRWGDRGLEVFDEAAFPGRRGYSGIAHPAALWNDWILHVESQVGGLIATDRRTGKQAWATALGKPLESHSAPVVVAGDTAYVARTDGTVCAIDLKRRKLVWTIDLRRDEKVRARDVFAPGVDRAAGVGPADRPRTIKSAPAIARDGMLLVATEGGDLYAIVDRTQLPKVRDRIERPEPRAVALEVAQVLRAGTPLKLAPFAVVLIARVGDDPEAVGPSLQRLTADANGARVAVPFHARVLKIDGAAERLLPNE